MRVALVILCVVLFSWGQVVYPAELAPWNLVPAMALIAVFALAVYYEPEDHVTWYSLAAGLSVDLWQPSHFGTWTIACLAVVLVTRLVHKRLMQQKNWTSILATAALALAAGELVVVVRESFGLSLSEVGTMLLRFWLPRLILDLVLVLPLSIIVRSVLTTLRVTTGNVSVNAVRR